MATIPRPTVLCCAVAVLSACGPIPQSLANGPVPEAPPRPSSLAYIQAIESIHFLPPADGVCPGTPVAVEFTAVLAPGHEGLARTGGRLSAADLIFESPHAVADPWGRWTVDPDPVLTALEGVRLTARLESRPEIETSVTIPPSYWCQPDALRLRPGDDARTAAAGPTVQVRTAEVSSPFFDRLLLLMIESDAEPTRTYLVPMDGRNGARPFPIVSEGAPGFPGATGRSAGRSIRAYSTAYCDYPIPGASGGPGGYGGRGGNGGRVVVRYDESKPYLAALVDARGVGGEGGPGGAGGAGGQGVSGGTIYVDPDTGARHCTRRSAPNGSRGPRGQDGAPGLDGPAPEYVATPLDELFRDVMTPEIRAILDYQRGAAYAGGSIAR